MTLPGGGAYAQSVGILRPAIAKGTLDSDRNLMASERIELLYRFTVFSFADDRGILTPPAIHKRLKTGAMVMVIIINHQPIPHILKEENGVTKLLLSLNVYTHCGDTIRVLGDTDCADVITPYRVDDKGRPAPIKEKLSN